MNESSHLTAALRVLEVKLARAQARVEALTKTRDSLAALLGDVPCVPESSKPKRVRNQIKWHVEVFGDSWKIQSSKRKFLVSVLPTHSAWTPTYHRWEIKHERQAYGSIEAFADASVEHGWRFETSLPVEFNGDVNDFLRSVAQAVKNHVEGRS